MHIKTTADIVNKVNWHGLNWDERHVLKTMIDLSFGNRLIQSSQVERILTLMNKDSIFICINSLMSKKFVECHILNAGVYYEIIPFTEQVPCV